jgi:Tol biopolymer transport system component
MPRLFRLTWASFGLIVLIILLLPHHLFAADIVYMDKEIIRNGDFATSLYTAWHVYWCDVHSLARKGEEGCGLRMEYLSNQDDHYAFQLLTLPTELSAARLEFDFRAEADVGVGIDDQPVILEVSAAISEGFDSENLVEASPLTELGILFTETIATEFDWRSLSVDLDPALIAKMQDAHGAGEHVFLQFSQRKSGTYEKHGFYADIDNVSFKVSGTQRVPELHGTIAYLEENDEGDPFAIGSLDPNTNETKRIWTHPEGEFDIYGNLAWKPDATELAFISDHDFQFSIFKADIFAIKPDGSGLHRIPGYSLEEKRSTGDFPEVTVRGAIAADTGVGGASYSVIMGIQGTNKGQMIRISEGETVSFTISEVPVLEDPDVFNQPLILQYWGGGCSAGIEYAFPVGAVGDGSVDLGTISFFASNCIDALTGYRPSDLSWKHDGSEIGFTLLGLRKMVVDATSEFEIEELKPYGSGLSSNLAWSPVDDRYLYEDFSFSGGGQQLFIAEEGGEAELLIDDYNGDVTPAWLPDGSGFIYVGTPDSGFDDNIYHHDLVSGEDTRLTYFKFEQIDTLSLSPEGRYIVFGLQDHSTDPSPSGLWIMDRSNPVEIWPITEGGSYINPDWSRKDVVLVDDAADDAADDAVDDSDDEGTDNDKENNVNGGGGGGGCFIASTM